MYSSSKLLKLGISQVGILQYFPISIFAIIQGLWLYILGPLYMIKSLIFKILSLRKDFSIIIKNYITLLLLAFCGIGHTQNFQEVYALPHLSVPGVH